VSEKLTDWQLKLAEYVKEHGKLDIKHGRDFYGDKRRANELIALIKGEK
jgi:hypothetical protein